MKYFKVFGKSSFFKKVIKVQLIYSWVTVSFSPNIDIYAFCFGNGVIVAGLCY